MNTTRRQFVLGAARLALLLPVGWTVFQAGCEGDECADADSVDTTATELTVTSSCGNGHTHEYSIRIADLVTPPAAGVSGNTTAYEDGHVHTVALTGAELAQIQSGATVSKESTAVNGHVHTFMFRKA